MEFAAKSKVIASKLSAFAPQDTEFRTWCELALERHDKIWQGQRARGDEPQPSLNVHPFMWIVIGMFVQSLLFWAVRQPGSAFGI